MKVPTTPPTPDQVKAARANSGLTQSQASKMIFGPNSIRRFQNWETGKRQVPLAPFVLFLLVTDQVTITDVQEAAHEFAVC